MQIMPALILIRSLRSFHHHYHKLTMLIWIDANPTQKHKEHCIAYKVSKPLSISFTSLAVAFSVFMRPQITLSSFTQLLNATYTGGELQYLHHKSLQL